MVAHSLYFAEASEITCFIWLFHVYFISMTKSVNTEFKATIHTFFIQKKTTIKMSIWALNACFFLCFGPITDMLCIQMNGIQLVCTVWCVVGPTTSQKIQCFIECKLLVRLRKMVLIVLCNTQIFYIWNCLERTFCITLIFVYCIIEDWSMM